MRVLLVDDNLKQVLLLNNLLEQNPYIESIKYVTNPLEALDILTRDSFDIVFLDVDMPELSGLDLSKKLNKKRPLIIFTTAFSHFAVSAFELNATDYLVKPYTRERLYFAVKKAKERLIEIDNTENSQKDKILVYDKESMVILTTADILYAEHLNRATYVVTSGKRYKYKGTLDSLSQKLLHTLTKCHKGYLVNMKKVNEIKPYKNRTYNISFSETNSQIPVSRTYIKKVLEHFKKGEE